MPKNNTITIHGTIDRWSFGSNFLNWELNDCKEGPVTLFVTSYGGDVNEALAMGNIIKQHGNVTVEYVGYNASSATLLGLFAAKSIIHEGGLFMVHKTSVWVDSWGRMNEDEIDQAIAKLKEKKEMAAVSTIQLAKLYAEKTGETVANMLSFMKEAKWISPEDAVAKGFVDEVAPAITKTQKVSAEVAALFECNGMPLPAEHIEQPMEDKERNLFHRFLAFMKGEKTNVNNSQPTLIMDKKYVTINSILNVEGIEKENESFKLTDAQMETIENQIKAKDDRISSLITSLAGLHDDIKNAKNDEEIVSAIQALLTRPAQPAANPVTTDVHEGTEDLEHDPVNDIFQ